MTVTEMTQTINLWHVTLWREEPNDQGGTDTIKVEPFDYIVALPKTQAIGYEVSRQQIITGGMLPEHAYAYENDRRVLARGFSVDAAIVEWEQPGNIARLFA